VLVVHRCASVEHSYAVLGSNTSTYPPQGKEQLLAIKREHEDQTGSAIAAGPVAGADNSIQQAAEQRMGDVGAVSGQDGDPGSKRKRAASATATAEGAEQLMPLPPAQHRLRRKMPYGTWLKVSNPPADLGQDAASTGVYRGPIAGNSAAVRSDVQKVDVPRSTRPELPAAPPVASSAALKTPLVIADRPVTERNAAATGHPPCGTRSQLPETPAGFTDAALLNAPSAIEAEPVTVRTCAAVCCEAAAMGAPPDWHGSHSPHGQGSPQPGW